MSDEHIIPDGIGGDLLLLEASREDCARIISEWKAHYINDAVGHLPLFGNFNGPVYEVIVEDL